ncbi:MAG TPA: hypothetical protein VGS57_10435 [Thermoanaerobaculia bacterium]|nr:hypothetical protein [Thermoanaerobaculia bacterium]
MKAARPALVALLLGAVAVPVAHAGTFLWVSTNIRNANPDVAGNTGPYAIVHPPGFNGGSSGSMAVRICVRAGSEPMTPPLQWAIGIWNRHVKKVGNCGDCLTQEDFDDGMPEPGTSYSLAGILLHELGHCALGLDHPNHTEFLETRPPQPWRTGECDDESNTSCGDYTSFTEAGNTTEILAGADGIRGSRDDEPLNQCGFATSPIFADPDEPSRNVCLNTTSANSLDFLPSQACAGTQCCPPCPDPDTCPPAPMQVQHVAWFRKSDNNPVVRDGTVIDRNTFSRRHQDLPVGSAYAANGNRRVALALGYPGTQAAMYTPLVRGQGWNGLTADDVDQLSMGNTGVDRLAGTADDYSPTLVLVADCALADIEAFFDPGLVGSLGGCESNIAPSPLVDPVGGLILHYTVAARSPNTKPLIRLRTNNNPMRPLDFLIPLPDIDFETGDLSEWSAFSP